MKKSWTEKNNELQKERERERKASNPEPRALMIKGSFKFDSMFGWIIKIKNKMKNLLLILSILTFILSLLMTGCSVTSVTRVSPNGTTARFYQGSVGGKSGAYQGADGSIASYSDNEKSFRDGVVGAVTYGIGTVIGGAVEAGYAAKTAQNAANQAAAVSNATTAARVSNTATTANLIKDVGLRGEVPISSISLP